MFDSFLGKRRYNIKLWKTFTDCFNCLPVAAIVDEKIFCCHGGLSPDLQTMEQIRWNIKRLWFGFSFWWQFLLCLGGSWDPLMFQTKVYCVTCFGPTQTRWVFLDVEGRSSEASLAYSYSTIHLHIFQDTMGWGENDRGVSFTFGAEVAAKFLHKHDFDLICRAHQVRLNVFHFKSYVLKHS